MANFTVNIPGSFVTGTAANDTFNLILPIHALYWGSAETTLSPSRSLGISLSRRR